MAQTIVPIVITIKEAAQQLGLNAPWLYAATCYDGCPCYRFGTSVRVKLSEVQEWLEQRKKEHAIDTTTTRAD
jgi:excisionase family DNA binding protein